MLFKGYFKSWQSSPSSLKSHSVWQLVSFEQSLRHPEVVWDFRICLVNRQMLQSMTRKFCRLLANEWCAALSAYVIYEKLLSYLPVESQACQESISIGVPEIWRARLGLAVEPEDVMTLPFTLWSLWPRLLLHWQPRSWPAASRSLLWSHWTFSCSRRNWGFSAEWWKAWPSCCLPSTLAQWWFWFWSPWRWHTRFYQKTIDKDVVISCVSKFKRKMWNVHVLYKDIRQMKTHVSPSIFTFP